MITLNDDISEILRLASNQAGNRDSLDQLHDVDRTLGTDYFDFNARHIGRKNFGKDSLKQYLNGIESENLKRIVAVLYSGRGTIDGSGGDPSSYRKFIQNKTKAELVAKISELQFSALKTYLEKGIQLANEKNINLDDLVL